jgi:hypothetical protein
MTTDHAAAAVHLLRVANCSTDDDDPTRTSVLLEALVHATLATRGEPAGHPVTPYREALTELREAVRRLISAYDHQALAMADSTYVQRLRELVGES